MIHNHQERESACNEAMGKLTPEELENDETVRGAMKEAIAELEKKDKRAIAMYLSDCSLLWHQYEIAEQRRKCWAYIFDNYGRDIQVLEYIDTALMPWFDRPGYLRLREDCKNGLIKTVVIADINRFIHVDELLLPMNELDYSEHKTKVEIANNPYEENWQKRSDLAIFYMGMNGKYFKEFQKRLPTKSVESDNKNEHPHKLRIKNLKDN